MKEILKEIEFLVKTLNRLEVIERAAILKEFMTFNKTNPIKSSPVLPESVIGAVFTSDRKSVLLIQRCDVPVWTLPGGGVELNESPEEAIVREIAEETGFTVQLQRLVGVYTPINKLAKHTHVYECIILKGSPSTSSETRAVQFFPLECLPKLIPPPYREWITDALLMAPPIYKALSSVTYFTLFKNFFLHPILVIRFLLARIGWTINS